MDRIQIFKTGLAYRIDLKNPRECINDIALLYPHFLRENKYVWKTQDSYLQLDMIEKVSKLNKSLSFVDA
jgi:hypothetical protein